MKGFDKVDSTAHRLEIILEEKGWSQAELLKRCEAYLKALNVKMNKSDISQFISGKYAPKQDKLYVLSKALGVSPAWLMGLDISKDGTVARQEEVKQPRMVSVYGRVAAGQPIEAIEEILDTVPLSSGMSEADDFYGLRIDGDSMEPQFQFGDYVIVRKQDYAEDGDIVIALIDGKDATCKQFRKHQDGISLVSLNPKYAPMFFTAKEVREMPVRIIGKVVELRRSL